MTERAKVRLAVKYRWIVAVLLLAASIVLGGLALPMPERVARRIALANADWLLTNYLDGPGEAVPYARNTTRKLTVLLLQSTFAHQLARSHMPASGLSDEDRIFATLIRLKPLFTSATTADIPSDASAFLTGWGFCDQVNGAAAYVFAQQFARSQTFNLWLPDERWGHTIGRVWSDRRHEWLYYDMFYDDVVVFRADAGSKVEVLRHARTQSAPRTSLDYDALLRLYGNVGDGWVMNRFYPTVAEYAMTKVWHAVSQRSLASVRPQRAPAPVRAQQTRAVPVRVALLSPESIAGEYAPATPLSRQSFMSARLDLLLRGRN